MVFWPAPGHRLLSHTEMEARSDIVVQRAPAYLRIAARFQGKRFPAFSLISDRLESFIKWLRSDSGAAY